MLFSYHLLYFCTALSLIIMLSSHYHHHKSKTFSQLTQCPFTGTLLFSFCCWNWDLIFYICGIQFRNELGLVLSCLGGHFQHYFVLNTGLGLTLTIGLVLSHLQGGGDWFQYIVKNLRLNLTLAQF